MAGGSGQRQADSSHALRVDQRALGAAFTMRLPKSVDRRARKLASAADMSVCSLLRILVTGGSGNDIPADWLEAAIKRMPRHARRRRRPGDPNKQLELPFSRTER